MQLVEIKQRVVKKSRVLVNNLVVPKIGVIAVGTQEIILFECRALEILIRLSRFRIISRACSNTTRKERVESRNTPCCHPEPPTDGGAGAPPPPPQAASVAAASNIIIRMMTVTDIIEVRMWLEFDFKSITIGGLLHWPESS